MEKTEQYLWGSTLYLEDELAFQAFVQTHRISQETFEKATQEDLIGTKISYSDGKVNEIIEVFEWGEEPVELTEHLKSFSFKAHPENEVRYMIPSTTMTNSYLGGEVPEGFHMPIGIEIPVPFQMIGLFSKRDPAFSWLPFEELVLVYPLFIGIASHLFLDYSDPMRPICLPLDQPPQETFGKMDTKGKHIFQKTPFSFQLLEEVEDPFMLSFENWYYGMTGVPNWVQDPEMLRSPKTGKWMKFVGQINGEMNIPVADSNLVSEIDSFPNNSQSLNFHGDGSLYIFMEPETKIVGFTIQST